MCDDGDSDIRDTEEMLGNKDGRDRYAGWWRWRRTKLAGETQVDKDSGIRHARCQGLCIRMSADTVAET